jgi:hypothetical protein
MDYIFRCSLDPLEKLVLLIIDAHDDGQGCRASNERLAKYIGFSESAIVKAITDIRKHNGIIDLGSALHRRVNSRLLGVPPLPWGKLNRSSSEMIKKVCGHYDMTARQKVLLFLIHVTGLPHAGHDESYTKEHPPGCALTNQQLADRTGEKFRSVTNDVRRLQVHNWLRVRGLGRNRVLWFDPDGLPMRPRRSQKKKITP